MFLLLCLMKNKHTFKRRALEGRVETVTWSISPWCWHQHANSRRNHICHNNCIIDYFLFLIPCLIQWLRGLYFITYDMKRRHVYPGLTENIKAKEHICTWLISTVFPLWKSGRCIIPQLHRAERLKWNLHPKYALQFIAHSISNSW